MQAGGGVCVYESEHELNWQVKSNETTIATRIDHVENYW